MKLFVLISSLLTTVAFSVQAQKNSKTTDQIPSIDSVLNQVLKDQHIAGFAVAIVKGDEVIYSKGFGYRDIENKKPVTPNTLFAIGSSSKAFTSSLVGLLEKEGKLKLDDKATSLLPQLSFYNAEMNNQITVRDLMAHRTGLSRYDYSWLLFNTANRDSIISRVKYMKPTSGVREKWYYNNFMFLAQGMIVEKISGKTWEQNIKEKFFIPLEMTRSNTDIKQFENDSDAALPYVTIDSTNKKIDYYNINGMGPAGSINSSVNDMANWLKVWISGGNFKGKNILPSSYVGEAASSQMVMDGGLPKGRKDIYISNYGLGWMLSSYRGYYEVEHGGNINGFSASVAFYPTEKLGVVVLTNQNNSQVPDVVRNSIVDRLFQLKPIDWNGDAKKAAEAVSKNNKSKKKEKNIVPNTTPSHQLKDYVGDFETPAYGVVSVTNEKNGLYAQAGNNRLYLKHVHFDVFEPKDVNKKGVVDTSSSENLFNFFSDNKGKISGLTIQLDPDKEPVLFTYKPKIKVLDIKLLQSYVGDYELGKTIIKVYLKANTLFVAVPGQPDYETLVVDDHTFDIKVLKGYSVKFEILPSRKVASLSFIQPNGTFVAERKIN
ncbi:serine hydrolase [Pedobacter xixiisoli]|uniref:CubicO group peptidase, beta-lactamase class C family n=1 Tax=Pedobacter xixiisoli TaxID=1476464 RepID=A0A285ZQ14_9SPHI|nr:serine hydrolase [Pedobacter xixiisoli]SOD11718.1 CubicO group peptidase, beta-lactamase class C family [Pedobacter xixiisoli]